MYEYSGYEYGMYEYSGYEYPTASMSTASMSTVSMSTVSMSTVSEGHSRPAYYQDKAKVSASASKYSLLILFTCYRAHETLGHKFNNNTINISTK
jgi:hypothetical protein